MSYGQYSSDRHERCNPLADKPKSTKRQKYVYKSDEIPHLWAHKTQDSARNAQGNFYFDGDTIYSYGSHYPLAKHVTINGQAAILINVSTRNRGGSVTTNSQRSSVRRAIPDSVTVFDVDSLHTYTIDHAQNISAYQYEAKQQLSKARNGRKYAGSALAAAFEQHSIATKYAAFFGLDAPDFSFLPSGLELEALNIQIAERRERARIADADRDRKEEARRLERQRIAALELPEKIAAWRNGLPVDSWTLRTIPTMLRIDGEQVVTSLGARVPVDHAKRALKIVRACFNSKREFVRNGHTVHIGQYAIDRIDADGTLTAGCHKISYSEIEALAPQLEAR
jgi:hypothetical protein